MNRQCDRLSAAYRWLSGQSTAISEQLIQWSEIASGSHDLDGLRKMSNRLCLDWSDHRFTLEPHKLAAITEIDSSGESLSWQTVDALVAKRRPQAERRALLAIHFDTVFERESSFRQCQWLDADRLQGPGVVDAKGGLLVMMWALAALEKFDLAPDIGWTAILNPDEEIGSPASASLFRSEASGHDFGLLFEPCLPDRSLVGRRKGSGNYTVVVRGRAAHAGRDPQLGRNAIVLLSKIIGDADRLNDLDGGLSVNVGHVQGGGPLNRVPDLAIGRLNARVANAQVQAKFEHDLQSIVQRANQTEGFEAALHGGFHAPPKMIDDCMRWLQQAVEASTGEDEPVVEWRSTGGACDGNKLAFYGLPNVDTLGPRGGDLHSPSEWVDTSTLVPKAMTIVRLLAGFSAGQYPQLARATAPKNG